MKTDPNAPPVYDRKEQRAIGHFIEKLTSSLRKKDRSVARAFHIEGVIKQLQREYGCYD
jgi:hypothetical protein